MTTYSTDEELIRGCVSNERRAWNTFVQEYSRYVYFMVNTTAKRYACTLDTDTVGDLHADIFTAFIVDDYRRLREFEGRNNCSLRSWVRMIAIRKTIDYLRKKKRAHVSIDTLRQTTSFEIQDPDESPLDTLITQETIRTTPALSQLIQDLSDSDRLLLDLYLVQKLRAPEVAKVLGVSVGAVYTRKNRLIEKLQAQKKKLTEDV
ncbi:MAG: RNA polymerase sigma factor [Bradymonadia bacterium]